MSTRNIGFYEDLTKNIFKLSSYSHLISSEYSAREEPLFIGSVNMGHSKATAGN